MFSCSRKIYQRCIMKKKKNSLNASGRSDCSPPITHPLKDVPGARQIIFVCQSTYFVTRGGQIKQFS